MNPEQSLPDILALAAASHAIRIHRHGGPKELRYETVEVGSPGPCQVLVRSEAVGLNFTDSHHRTGRYPGPALPMGIGMEGTGVIVEVGSNVGEFKPGDRIARAGASPNLSPGSDSESRKMHN